MHNSYLCCFTAACFGFWQIILTSSKQEQMKLELFTLRVSWLLYLALMRGVWMMSRLVPVTVTGVWPLKQRDKVKRSRQMVGTDGDDISVSGHVETFELLMLETCIPKTFQLEFQFQNCAVLIDEHTMRLLTCRCSTRAQSWWWWDPPHTQSAGLSGDELCWCSRTQKRSRSRAARRGSCRWATDHPS